MRRGVFTVVLAACLLVPAGSLGHPGHASVSITITQFAYQPREAAAIVGDTVTWTWKGPDTDHSVTSDSGQAERFNSDPSGPPLPGTHPVNDSFSHTFTKPGRFTYHCKTHAFMTGAVTVAAGPSGLPDTTAPVIRSMRVRPNPFCFGRRCKAPRLVIEVSEAASLKGQVQRRAGRRWKRSRNLPPIVLRKGVNRKPLAIGSLAPGRYRIFARADDDAANASRPRTAPFAVRRGTR